MSMASCSLITNISPGVAGLYQRDERYGTFLYSSLYASSNVCENWYPGAGILRILVRYHEVYALTVSRLVLIFDYIYFTPFSCASTIEGEISSRKEFSKLLPVSL